MIDDLYLHKSLNYLAIYYKDFVIINNIIMKFTFFSAYF